MAENAHGLVAVFDTASSIYRAAEKVRDAGFKRWDVITPFPIHGLDEAMGMKRSLVPIFTFFGGITGLFGGMFMIAYMNWIDYPIVVHGRPYFSPLSSFPVSFELTILLSALASIFGMFILNGLPMHYHPVLKWNRVHISSDDKFLLIIESSDPKYDREKTKQMLEEIGGIEIEELEA